MEDIKNMKLSDDELEGVTGGQTLIYNGNNLDKNNLLMDDRIEPQNNNLLFHKNNN